jgi:hypothetical protein
MTFHSLLLLLSFCILLCLAWLWHLDWAHHGLPHLAAKTAHPMVHRLLKPRTPLDCPACRLALSTLLGEGPAPAPVRPWREVRSRWGAPKRVNTEGYACPNPRCSYSGITDAHVHALVGRDPRQMKKYVGTVALSAVGMFGKGAGWGVLPANPPSLCVTVGGIGEKPGVVDGQIAIREYLSLTISFDHDIIDGAPAARFTQRLKELIESGYGLDDSTIEPELTGAEAAAQKR